MKKGTMLKILILFLSLTVEVNAREFKDWANQEVNLPDLKINDLRFSNRARCALDSQVPTQSAFLMVNNMDAARGIYRLAQATNNDTNELTTMGIKVYRYTVIQLLQLINSKLASGDLPLLPADLSEKNGIPGRYKNISLGCKSGEYCTELDEYISQVWSASNVNTDNRSFELSKVDDFDNRLNFIDDKVYLNKKEGQELTCYYLKKFSPLQAHLYGVKPDAKVFEEMAKVNINRADYLGSCDDFEDQKNQTVALYQIELNSLKERVWNKVGFDYWNSLKLYFSWAWRNAPEFEQMAAPFGKVLRSVALEESVIIIPNGCKSIVAPKCDGDYLALNSLREFAKGEFKKEALNTDILSAIPEGPQADLLEEEFPTINTDVLDMAEFENSTKWMENFTDNLKRGREIMKKKLIKSINFLNIVTDKMSPEQMLGEIKKRFASLGLNDAGEINITNMDPAEVLELKNEFYYLCGEFTQANHEDFSFIKGDLNILRKTTLIDTIANQLAEEKTETYFDYYKQIADLVSKSCDSLKQHDVWGEDFNLDKTGFSKWYLDKIYEGKIESNANSILSKTLKGGKPLLAYKGQLDDGKDFEDIICVNGSDCARKTLASIIDLYAVAQYANTFWEMEQKVKTPAMVNPYAERTQCKVYDPWFATKKLIFDLFVNAGQAAMSAFVPGAVFANMTLQPGRVVSFKELVKEGKIEYDIKRDRTTVEWGLLADFGSLLGVPCTVSISKYIDNPYQLYTFAGVSVGACYNRSHSTLNVYSASEIMDPVNRSVNVCASCTLNFETVVNSATAIGNFAPYVGPVLYFFKGIVQLYKALKDPNNIPRDWASNPNYVLDTYRRFGNIPKRCVFDLRHGKPCLENRKEEHINAVVKRVLKTNIKSIKGMNIGRTAEIKVFGCDKPIGVRLKMGFGNGDLDVPAECANLVRGEVEEDKSMEFLKNLPEYDLSESETPVLDTINDASMIKAEFPEDSTPEVTVSIREPEAKNFESEPEAVAEVAPSVAPLILEEPIMVEKLTNKNCSLSESKYGGYFLFIWNMSIKNIKDVGAKKANWFLKTFEGKTFAFKDYKGQDKVFLNNLSFYLKENTDSIELRSMNPKLDSIKINLNNCKGFESYKLGLN